MSEDGIVNDSVQIYEWIRSFTKNDIFLWGHSLGGALTLHTVRNLKELGIVPMGVVIESSFTTMREEVKGTSIAKVSIPKYFSPKTVLISHFGATRVAPVTLG